MKEIIQNEKKQMNKKIPSYGVKILEKIYKKNPHNQLVRYSLIRAYIRFNNHDIALKMIADIPDNKGDYQTLRFKAWKSDKYGDIGSARQFWDTILEDHYLSQVHNKVDTMLLRSHKKNKLKPSDIPLFCVERNEMLRLPFFLDYYRNLGVTQFIFIDNNSDDGSFEFLLQQEDCHVFWTNDSYNESGHGLTWLNMLINDFDILVMNQWYVIADADEFLVYPNCENAKLPEFIDYLNQEKAEAVPSFMLDMYPKKLGDNDANNSYFLQQHNYFYNNYQKFYQLESPYIKTVGGIRTVLFTEYNDYVKTALFKKTNNPCTLISSTHQTTPCKTSKISSVFLHYKFSGGLKQTSANEIKSKQHSGGAVRYRHYYQGLTSELYSQDLSQLSKSTKYQNSQQLVDLGLINSTDEWKRFLQK